MSTAGPRLLLIESSGLNCGVAYYADGRIQSSFNHWVPQVHDRELAAMCRQLFDLHHLKATDLDAVAISAGPGSFTGLRIGASLVKGLCFANQPRLISIPTLEALAKCAASRIVAVAAERIVVVVAAQTGKVYTQNFTPDGNALDAPLLLDEAEMREQLHTGDAVIGPAAEIFRTDGRLHAWYRLHPEHLVSLALERYADDDFSDADTFRPLYIQDFQPKITPLDPLMG